MAKDPVCGMVVKEKKGLECKCQGRTYNSCSPLCKDLFESSPESYVARIAACVVPDKKERRIAYFPMEIARKLTSGVDLWLNTPQRPMEASGTSGMKAAHNGIPSLSVLDGWWMEGHIEGVTGWSIGPKSSEQVDDHRDALEIYEKLEKIILPIDQDFLSSGIWSRARRSSPKNGFGIPRSIE